MREPVRQYIQWHEFRQNIWGGVTTIAYVAFSGEKQNISFGQIGHKINWMGRRISGKYVNTEFLRRKPRKIPDKIQ